MKKYFINFAFFVHILRGIELLNKTRKKSKDQNILVKWLIWAMNLALIFLMTYQRGKTKKVKK